MTPWNELCKLQSLVYRKTQKKLFELRNKKCLGDGKLKKKLQNIFGNLQSGSWHFLRLGSNLDF